jgi:hypothetical protein
MLARSSSLIAVILLFVGTQSLAGDHALDASIQFLLTRVSQSGYVFIRNGKEHNSQDAAKHMRRKYEHFADEIETPEQFIERAATKSMITGRRYRIRFADGMEMDTSDWLLNELALFRDGETTGAGGGTS